MKRRLPKTTAPRPWRKPKTITLGTLPEIVGLVDAALALGLQLRELIDLVRTGDLVAYSANGVTYIPVSAIEAYRAALAKAGAA